MRTRIVVLGLALAAGLPLTAGCAGTPRAPGSTPAGALRLASYDTCDDLLANFRRAAGRYVTPYGLANPAYARDVVAPDAAERAPGAQPDAAGKDVEGSAAPAHSDTNNQETGVAEPDLVKTDGKRIVTVSGGTLRVVDAARRTELGHLDLGDGAVGDARMLLAGDRVLVISQSTGVVADGATAAAPPGGPVRKDPVGQDPGGQDPVGAEEPGTSDPAAPAQSAPAAPAPSAPAAPATSGPDAPTTSGPDAPDAPDTSDVPGRSVPPARPLTGPQLSLVDISGPPRVLGRLTVDGGYVDARQVGRTARIVVSSVPHLDFPPPRAGGSASDLTARNRRIVQHSTVQDWLPRYRLERDGRSTDGRVPCPAVEHPAEYSATAMLTVLTVDLKRALDDGSPLTVVGDGQSVYATGHSLYVAGVRQPAGPEIRGRYRPATDIRQFDISGTARPRYLAGGTVPGSLLNQYSMSEYQGRLRVAVTDGVGEDMASTVHVLARDGTTLRTRGSVGGLGHGERIMAVRFLGPVGYVVTFRQTDPLYTIDLSDPAHPRTVGELHLTGYSSYLHPVGANRLIGIGQDATKAGQTTGLLVSLFDVDEPAAPRRVASYHLPGGYTAAEFDPHAFLYWPETGLLVVPVQPTGVVADPSGSSPAREQQPGALVLRVRGDSLARLGMVRHPADRLMPWDPIQRSLVVGTTLWTVSSAGLLATDQESLSRQAWLPVA